MGAESFRHGFRPIPAPALPGPDTARVATVLPFERIPPQWCVAHRKAAVRFLRSG